MRRAAAGRAGRPPRRAPPGRSASTGPSPRRRARCGRAGPRASPHATGTRRDLVPGQVPGPGPVVQPWTLTWPRISPPVFFFVWTLTYVAPESSAGSADAGTVAVPDAPERHGPHSGTRIPPERPGRPPWMCAATAAPLSFPNFSCQSSVAPDDVRVRSAVNDPVPPFDPLSFPTTCFVSSVAPTRVGATTENVPRIVPVASCGSQTNAYAPGLSVRFHVVSVTSGTVVVWFRSGPNRWKSWFAALSETLIV